MCAEMDGTGNGGGRRVLGAGAWELGHRRELNRPWSGSLAGSSVVEGLPGRGGEGRVAFASRGVCVSREVRVRVLA